MAFRIVMVQKGPAFDKFYMLDEKVFFGLFWMNILWSGDLNLVIDHKNKLETAKKEKIKYPRSKVLWDITDHADDWMQKTYGDSYIRNRADNWKE